MTRIGCRHKCCAIVGNVGVHMNYGLITFKIRSVFRGHRLISEDFYLVTIRNWVMLRYLL